MMPFFHRAKVWSATMKDYPLAPYIHYFLGAAKTSVGRRQGLEFELIGYCRHDLQRIDRATVQRLMVWFSVHAIHAEFEGDVIIGVKADWGCVTLEPGGQVEFSSYPRLCIADIEADFSRFLSMLSDFADQQNLAFIACGFDPLRSREEQRWIVKRRYSIMRPFLAVRGDRGLDMMTRTAAIQVSVDYTSAAELLNLYVLGNRLGPVMAALFANSPYENGRRSGYKSTRYGVWLRTDPCRCSIGPTAVFGCLTLESFIESVLAVPTLLVHREGQLVPTHGRLLCEIEDPKFEDFVDLLSTIFTDARVRTYIEMRSADAGHIADAFALMALWKGLTHDASAMQQAMKLAPRLDYAGYRKLCESVAVHGFEENGCGVPILKIARSLYQVAKEGLQRVAPEELHYLARLEERLQEGMTPADLLLRQHKDDAIAAVNTLRMV
jgi:glutamate--cysteine ligase